MNWLIGGSFVFCGPIDKLQDFGSFDDTFQHYERVGEQTVDLGSFDGTFQQKKYQIS